MTNKQLRLSEEDMKAREELENLNDRFTEGIFSLSRFSYYEDRKIFFDMTDGWIYDHGKTISGTVDFQEKKFYIIDDLKGSLFIKVKKATGSEEINKIRNIERGKLFPLYILSSEMNREINKIRDLEKKILFQRRN